MRKVFKLLLLTFFFLTAFSVSAQEKIDKFVSEIVINKDGTINVTETINYDFGSQYRHGIFRDIPYIKTNQEGKKFLLNINVGGVTDPQGAGYQYTTSKINNNLQLKIGDPDETITGVHTYIIKYQVSGALTYFSDHDELYWNVSGNEWPVSMGEVTSIVKFQDEITPEQVRLTCYTGVFGSTASECASSYQGNQAVFVAERPLSSGEGLTVVVGFPKNIVAVVEPKEYIPFWETPFGKALLFVIITSVVILATLWYLVYPVWIIIKWYRFGRDPDVGIPARAWFDPPKTATGRPLTPAETGTLIDETAQMRDISALLVDLARRGYFKIEERKKKDFYLLKKKEFVNDSKLLEFEKKLLTGIFKDEDEVRLKDKHLFTTVADVQGDLYDSLVKEKYFPKNPQSVRAFYTVMAVLGAFTFNIQLLVIALIFGRAMPVKTRLGAEAANVAKSLKNFLSSQERQLKFQASKQLMFEKLLPFAVAFGVEKIWAERFKDINLREPDWYSGYQSGHFNSVVFANSLNSSFRSFTSAATPTSSSSGFSSGFSGGSSGGGGGGGGGGSW